MTKDGFNFVKSLLFYEKCTLTSAGCLAKNQATTIFTGY